MSYALHVLDFLRPYLVCLMLNIVCVHTTMTPPDARDSDIIPRKRFSLTAEETRGCLENDKERGIHNPGLLPQKKERSWP